MNFFGHALVAAHKEADPRFVLGSMLPDFASMLRVRVPPMKDAQMLEGVGFHHATDRVFHDSASFRKLNLEATHELKRLGVRRGTVRAVAHVGVEYMIDGELAKVLSSVVPSYEAALSVGRELADGIAWSQADERVRFSRLCAELGRLGVGAFTSGVNGVVRRLGRALANRPRLAICDQDLPRVERWARLQSGRVAMEVPSLLAELSRNLGVLVLHGQIR